MTNDSKSGSVSWGLIGTANIARKNWLAIKNSGNGTVAAVASRSFNRATEFIGECLKEVPFPETPVAIEGYQSMLERDDIDAVYVPLPTGLRSEVVIAAARAGKHVVCEKPCAHSTEELRAMTQACAENNVQFMDGVMFRHSKRMDAIAEVLKSDSGIGKLKRINSQFSFLGGDEFKQNDIRLRSDLEKFGCLGDLGWYNVLFTLCANNFEMPIGLSAQLIESYHHPDSEKPVPTEVSVEMTFVDGVTAAFYCSFDTQHQQWATICGTEGYLSVSDFVLPFTGESNQFKLVRSEFDMQGCKFAMSPGRKDIVTQEYSHGHETAQESNLFRNFGELVLSGQVDNHWPEAALKTQRIIDACYESAFNRGKLVDLESS